MTVERVDLVRDGGEAVKLREHLAWSLYPEYAEDIEAVQRAIVLCACGRDDGETRRRKSGCLAVWAV